MLCLRRTLASGFAIGFASGLGAATADATYAAIASFSVSALASVLLDHRLWLQVAGGAFLLYLGIRALMAQPVVRDSTGLTTTRDLASAYASTLTLTISNPMTILSFAAIFAGIAAGSFALVGGVFAGSAAWWLVLATTASRVRGNLASKHLRLINIASGVLIVAFALQSLGAALLQT